MEAQARNCPYSLRQTILIFFGFVVKIVYCNYNYFMKSRKSGTSTLVEKEQKADTNINK